MEVAFCLRHGTQDKEVYEDVLLKNQYRLPEQIDKDSLVIDIGANIGAFAVACLLRGAGTVVCFEPCEKNYLQLSLNVRGWPGQVPVFNAAVWRSDRNEKLKFIGCPKNTACGTVISETVEAICVPKEPPVEVASMGLDEVLFHATDGGKRRVDILKIDAEGSEYPILYTARHLDMVDTLLVESHQCITAWPQDQFKLFGFPNDEACADGMTKFLEKNGFVVESVPESDDNRVNTLHFAKRKKNDAA
jgi:FkbM family methyltransferase